MHPLTRGAALACALFGALATGAFAQQDVPFTTLAQGNFAPGSPPAGRHVITNEQELRALNLDQAIGGPIDWSSETVLAVFMGTQSSGGYGISIDRITHEQLATILPVPAPPPAYLNTVYVSERTPSGPAISVITSPFHVVKIRSLPGGFSFQAGAPPPPPPVGQPFREVKLHTQIYDGGQWPWTSDVVVEANGDVSVLRSHPTALVMPIYGQASAAELRQLTDAVRGARVGTLPNPLDVVIPMHLIAEPFSLTVSSPIPALAGETSGQYGYYGQYDAKLRPLISVIESIKARLMAEFGTRAISGRVRISAGQVVIQDGGERYAVSNADQASILRKFRGRTVEVRGRASQAPGGGYDLEVARIVNPEPVDQGLMVYLENNDAKVFYDGATRITEGRLARLLRDADGERVTLKGYAFRDGAGEVESVFVDQVRGTALRFSSLRVSGQWTGYVRPGEQVWVQQLSRTGRYVRVEGANGSGYLRVNALRIGEPVPLHSGLSGALAGN
ncbi:MAG: protease complex subunit PrcB family protein [Planctomycetes bacterium]|nr:protease complex subunit PrcB family protein [Planctomycetota bacterium]